MTAFPSQVNENDLELACLDWLGTLGAGLRALRRCGKSRVLMLLPTPRRIGYNSRRRQGTEGQPHD